jgi:sugar lactone lactonase YvrE
MDLFDRVLLEPTAEELGAALREALGLACADAGLGEPLVVEGDRPELEGWDAGERNWGADPLPFAWPKEDAELGRLSAGSAAGWRFWDLGPETFLLAAWWTDRVGRKHHRVGASSERSAWLEEQMRSRREADRALALVHPDQVFFRTPPRGERRVEAACACGAVGPPAALGWMGTCCAPCHDAREAGEPPQGAGAGLLQRARSSGVGHLAFGPDGKTLAWLRSLGGLLILAPLGTGGAPARVSAPGAVWFSFAPDGDRLVVADAAGRVWEVRLDGARRLLTEGPPGGPPTYSANGSWWAVTGGEGVMLFDLPAEGRKPRREVLPSEGEAALTCLALAPNSKALAVGRPQGVERVGFARKHERGSLPLDGVPVRLAYAPDGRTLAVLQDTGDLLLWKGGDDCLALTEEETRLIVRGYASTPALAFSPDGSTLLASCARAGTLLAWDAGTGRPVAEIDWHGSPVGGLAFSPDGTLFATGDGEGAVRLWPAGVLRVG